MTVLLLHDAVAADARPDERDVLAQVERVQTALHEGGLSVECRPIEEPLSRVAGAIGRLRPRAVFNLVESIGGRASRICELPELLEKIGVAFTGSSSAALARTTDKLAAKRSLAEAGLPTPAWIERQRPLPETDEDRWILKPVCEDGSVGIDDASVVRADAAAVRRAIERRRSATGELFGEAYIDGRELNVSLLERGGRVQVLPVAEIRFEGFPPEKPRIVGYAAKWIGQSFEYAHTPRSFELPAQDAELIRQVEGHALACFSLFELRGYARVDFRVDAAGRPWILEVNANPCLAPDAGFLQAAGRAGLSPRDVCLELVESARRGAA